jgi:hypothetical protein
MFHHMGNFRHAITSASEPSLRWMSGCTPTDRISADRNGTNPNSSGTIS